MVARTHTGAFQLMRGIYTSNETNLMMDSRVRTDLGLVLSPLGSVTFAREFAVLRGFALVCDHLSTIRGGVTMCTTLEVGCRR